MTIRVLKSEGIALIKTPIQAPNANAYAERWIRSIRVECLDRTIIFYDKHLCSVLKTYTLYDNHFRPHQGLHQQTPIPTPHASGSGAICRRDLLNGILHHYERAA